MTMTAVRWCPGQGAILGEEAHPEPRPGEAVIAPLAVGLCGTDRHIIDGNFPAAPGVVLGHEVCGRVVAVNDRQASVGVGDLVTVEPHWYCGQCFYCRAGDEHLCDQKKGYGVKLDGGLATRQVIPARILYRLPPTMPPEIGALAEPVACCVHAMDMLQPRAGESAFIHGCGPGGAILVRMAKLAGLAPIVVSEPSERRRELARAMGADVVVDPGDPRWRQQAVDASGGIGYRHLIDAVGNPRLVEESVALAARGARILVFGVARPDATASIAPWDLYAKELTLVSSAINPFTHQRAVALLPKLGLDQFRTISFPLSEIHAALAAQRSGDYDKVFVAPQEEEELQ